MSEREKKIYESMDAIAAELRPEMMEEFAWLVKELGDQGSKDLQHTRRTIQSWLYYNGYLGKLPHRQCGLQTKHTRHNWGFGTKVCFGVREVELPQEASE